MYKYFLNNSYKSCCHYNFNFNHFPIMQKPFAQNIIQISFPPNCNNLQILIQFANQTDTGKVKPIKIDAVLVWL